MSNQAKKFNTKMLFIYEKISNNSLDEFTKLFWIKSNKTTFENRRYNLSKNWLKNTTLSKNFHKEYKSYPFSLLTFDGQTIFRDVQEFLEIDIQRFKERIENYVEYKNKPIVSRDLNFQYLYTFSFNGVENNKNIDYYHIKYLSASGETIDIEVTPPKNKKSLNIDSYKGTLKFHENKLIISFSNSKDYISAIFNLELMNRHTNYVVGVVIGIADFNEKIPVAKKVILSKTAISDITELYLTLNESEIISAKENYYPIKYNSTDLKKSHLEKYAKKVDRLNNLFKNLSQVEYFNSFYEQLAFKEFSSLNHIFQKIKHNKSYYTSSRRKILDILLNSYHTQKYTTINMVMPVYQSDNIFEHQSKHALRIQNRFKELSRKISVNIIFIINNCNNPFSIEFKTFLTQIQSSVNISIAYKKDIEYKINSIDFLYTDNNYTISKYLRLDSPVFYIVQDMQTTVDEHQAIYRKIAMRSVSYEEFMKDKSLICTKKNPLLETLSGEWYHYVYGSKIFWEDKVIIDKDGRVEYWCEDKKTETGEIIIKEYQSVILLDDPITKRLFTIIFDNQPYKIQKAFFTKNIAKQFETDLDIFTIGILSRKPIPIDKALDILGDVDDVRFLEKSIMSKKLADYLTDNYGYQHTHIKK